MDIKTVEHYETIDNKEYYMGIDMALTTVQSLEEFAQLIQHEFNTGLGEWFFDLEYGVDHIAMGNVRTNIEQYLKTLVIQLVGKYTELLMENLVVAVQGRNYTITFTISTGGQSKEVVLIAS